MSVDSIALAKRVIDGYADAQGLTNWDLVHAGVFGRKKRALIAVLENGPDGVVTPKERNVLARAGFDDDFIETIAGANGFAAYDTRAERLGNFAVSPIDIFIGDDDRDLALSTLKSMGRRAANSIFPRYMTAFQLETTNNPYATVRDKLLRGMNFLYENLQPDERKRVFADILSAVDDPSQAVRTEAMRFLKNHWREAIKTPLESEVIRAASKTLSLVSPNAMDDAMGLVADVYQATTEIDYAAVAGPLAQLLIKGNDLLLPKNISVERHHAMLLLSAVRGSTEYERTPLRDSAEKVFFCAVASLKYMQPDQIKEASGVWPWNILADQLKQRLGKVDKEKVEECEDVLSNYFGGGACFTGDAKLFMPDGTSIEFDELFARFASEAGVVRVANEEGPNDIVLSAPNINGAGIMVAGRDDATGEVRYEAVKKMFAHTVETSLVDIGYEGKDGRMLEISATENHPLAMCDGEGHTLGYTRAGDLTLGAYLCMEGTNTGRVSSIAERPFEGTIYHLHVGDGDHNYLIAPSIPGTSLKDAISAHNMK